MQRPDMCDLDQKELFSNVTSFLAADGNAKISYGAHRVGDCGKKPRAIARSRVGSLQTQDLSCSEVAANRTAMANIQSQCLKCLKCQHTSNRSTVHVRFLSCAMPDIVEPARQNELPVGWGCQCEH